MSSETSAAASNTAVAGDAAAGPGAIRAKVRYSGSSVRSAAALPNTRLASSIDSAWTSILLELHSSSGESDAFDVEATDDQTVVAAMSGAHEVDVLKAGRWTTATMKPGSVGTSAPGEAARLRWRSIPAQSEFQTAHLYIPPALFEETFDEHRAPGRRASTCLLSALSFNDSLVHRTISILLHGMENGAGDLYAQSACAWISAHLLHKSGLVDLEQKSLDVSCRRSNDHRIQNAVEAMRSRLADEITLEEISRGCGLSKFHFLRLFKRETGATPWQFLSELRLCAARHLLLTTEQTVTDISLACGYRHPTNFSTAFSRYYGETPSDVRRQPGATTLTAEVGTTKSISRRS